MYTELEDGTRVQFVGGGSLKDSVQSACWNSENNPRPVAYVYMTMPGSINEYAVCTRALTGAEVEEACEAARETEGQQEDERVKLRSELLGPRGLTLVAERQHGNLDGNTASTDLAKAVSPSPIARATSAGPRSKAWATATPTSRP